MRVFLCVHKYRQTYKDLLGKGEREAYRTHVRILGQVFKSDESSQAPWKLNDLCLNRESDMTSSKKIYGTKQQVGETYQPSRVPSASPRRTTTFIWVRMRGNSHKSRRILHT